MLQRNWLEGLYFCVTTVRLLDLFFDANSCVVASVKVAFLSLACGSFPVCGADAASLFTVKTALRSFEKLYSSLVLFFFWEGGLIYHLP